MSSDAPGDGRQVPLHRDQHDQHHAPPEDRHGVAGQCQANSGVVENRTTLNGSQYANRDTYRGREDHGADTEFQRRFKARYELVPHRKYGFSVKSLNHRATRPRYRWRYCCHIGLSKAEFSQQSAHDVQAEIPRSPAIIITGSPGIIWTKAKVRRVIPINVGITSPRRRRMNCNITRILSDDARPVA